MRPVKKEGQRKKDSQGDFEKPTEPLHVEIDCGKYDKQDKGKDSDKIDF